MNTPQSIRKTSARLVLASLVALPAASALAQEHEERGAAEVRAMYLNDLEGMESKFLDLADAMGSDTYTWRPMDGVRTVSEVFMLIAAENYIVPGSWGAEAPEGMTADMSAFGTLAKVTDKAEVLDHLRQSFAYCKDAVGKLSGETLHSKIQFFGEERSVNESLYLISTDMHEHLGQAIAYARMNHVVPPWTARRQANR